LQLLVQAQRRLLHRLLEHAFHDPHLVARVGGHLAAPPRSRRTRGPPPPAGPPSAGPGPRAGRTSPASRLGNSQRDAPDGVEHLLALRFRPAEALLDRDQVLPALQIEVTRHFADAQLQVLLLPQLALVERLAEAAEQRGA